MKKILLLLVLMMLLVSCKQKELHIDEISLNGNVYSFTGEEEGYHIYQFDDLVLEVSYGEENTQLFFVLDDDIFIIDGNNENIVIKKNGSTIQICTVESFECSGFEEVDFANDIKIFFQQVQNLNE